MEVLGLGGALLGLLLVVYVFKEIWESSHPATKSHGETYAQQLEREFWDMYRDEYGPPPRDMENDWEREEEDEESENEDW